MEVMKKIEEMYPECTDALMNNPVGCSHKNE